MLILSIVSSNSVFQPLINQYVGVKFACAVLFVPSVNQSTLIGCPWGQQTIKA